MEDRKIKLSLFTTITDPERRGDNWAASMCCYEALADEVVVIDGSDYTKQTKDWADSHSPDGLIHKYSLWPQEFEWPLIGQKFQEGYEAATGDWVIHADLDFLFHERDFGRIRQALKDYPSSPAVSFYKWQFILPDRYNLKSRLVLAVNKAAFGDRIKFNGGGDGCQPTLDGKDLNLDELPQAGVPFYNYEKLLKTREQVADDVGRMDRAYFRTNGVYMYGFGDDESALEGWLHMVTGRFNKPQEHIPLHKHPKYIQEAIRNLNPDQFGYSGFDRLGENDYI